jgi:hypothetical protein
MTKLMCLVYRLQLLFRTRTNPEDHHDVISSPALSRELSLPWGMLPQTSSPQRALTPLIRNRS